MATEVLLAIETSQREGGLALRDPDGRVHVETLSEDKRHDDDLLPAIDRLFKRASLAPHDLSAVGVSIGPGGFTGLRIAVTTAKMFAMTLGARIVAVPSALVAAESCEQNQIGEGPVLVALAAKRNGFWATRLVKDDSRWSIAGGAHLAVADTVELDGLSAIIGDKYLPEPAKQRCAAAVLRIVEPRFDARACLEAADRMLKAGEIVDAHSLAPMYPRPPEAVSLWQQRQGRQGT